MSTHNIGFRGNLRDCFIFFYTMYLAQSTMNHHNNNLHRLKKSKIKVPPTGL